MVESEPIAELDCKVKAAPRFWPLVKRVARFVEDVFVYGIGLFVAFVLFMTLTGTTQGALSSAISKSFSSVSSQLDVLRKH